MNKKTLMIVGVVVVVLLIAGAVSRLAGKSAAEHAIEAATGGKVDVNGDEMTVKTDQGTWSTSSKLPDDFPSDVPVYPGAKVISSIASAGQGSAGHYVSLETSDKLPEVIAWYKKEVAANGWKVETDAMVNGNLILSASKDDRALSATVSGDGDEGKVTIGLSVADK